MSGKELHRITSLFVAVEKLHERSGRYWRAGLEARAMRCNTAQWRLHQAAIQAVCASATSAQLEAWFDAEHARFERFKRADAARARSRAAREAKAAV